MGKMSASTGTFLIPTAPAVGITCAQSASANTFGSLTQIIASTGAALFITGVYVEAATATNIPTYVCVELAVVAATIVGTFNMPVDSTSGVAATTMAMYKPIWPPIPVATATKILAATASSVASAINWNVTLEVINQANVVDDGIAETANATQFAGQTITAAAGVTLPSSVASPTNITAGTITTTTNLTNAPTAGDFTATMKTSLQANTGAGKTTFNE